MLLLSMVFDSLFRGETFLTGRTHMHSIQYLSLTVTTVCTTDRFFLCSLLDRKIPLTGGTDKDFVGSWHGIRLQVDCIRKLGVDVEEKRKREKGLIGPSVLRERLLSGRSSG